MSVRRASRPGAPPSPPGGTVALSATLGDANRVPVAGRTVGWSASDGVLQDVVATTDANGVVSAALRLPQDYLNRDIHVDIASRDHATRASVRTYGTTVDVEGASSVVYGDDAELEITLRAGNGQPIANRAVSVTSRAGHAVLPGRDVVTDANGVAAVTVAGLQTSDLVTVSAFDPGAGMDATHALEVSSDRLAFDGGIANAELTVGREHRLSVVWTQDGVPVVAQPLRVTTTAGRIAGDDERATDTATGLDGVVISASTEGAGDAGGTGGVDSRTNAELTVVERVLNVTLGAGNRIDSKAPSRSTRRPSWCRWPTVRARRSRRRPSR